MAVVATGFFDGVHIGHRMVVETLVSEARKRGEESLVLTFWPHPRIVLAQDAMGLRLLNTPDEKISLLKDLGVDRVVQLEFTREFSRMGTEQYLREIVKERFGGSAILLGYDNRIGHDSLTPAQTADIASSLGLDVIRAEKVSAVGIAVSSTKIRTALNAGDVETASSYLCYDYSLSGTVVHGKKLGRTIGFPTANMEVDEPLKLVPATGVYLSRVEIEGKSYSGMTNVGDAIETHIFDFDEDIYGHTIKVSFIRHVRNEMTFGSLQELKTQLHIDEDNCKKLLSLHK
ncbi:MAG: riboflavin biosynthesis protein RibF [Bacteroidales bacterium]|nr:riboflavin biosynthesis protein RibF [Bacteroidales bacterium]